MPSKLGLGKPGVLRHFISVPKLKTIVRIARAEGDQAVSQVRVLFREYAAGLTIDLCFQNFERELAGLPGEYGSPTGRLYLAFATDSPKVRAGSETHETGAPVREFGAGTLAQEAGAAGCVALRKFDAEACELKRLYVRPEFRGQGVARALVEEATRAARELGYRKILLDTLPEMIGAQALYRSIGFKEVPAYRSYDVPGVRFLELALS
jgi:ribosomal protein S18 acetylase RimI-like enzyme